MASLDNSFQKYNAQHVLRDYFKDRDSYNFKYGLEFGLRGNPNAASTENSLLNLDEDPTMLGFDLVILDNSPLFNDIDTFFDFGSTNNINEVSNRAEMYQDFISQFSKFFNVDDRNRGDFKINNKFNSFKTHYLNKVSGLDNLIHHIGIGNDAGKQMTEHGADKISINMSEDVGLNAGVLSALYRTLIYSKKSGRQVIPENLLRFDMVVIISEIRKFHRVSNTLSDAYLKQNPSTMIPIFNENINRYVFTLYDCQLDFNSFSFGDEITQAGYGANVNISDGINFDVFFKYVGFNMEKFNFNPDMNNEKVIIINDQKVNPSSNQMNTDTDSKINQDTEAKQADKSSAASYDLRYHRNTIFNNDDVDREYLFDFPMINSDYQKAQIELRNKNIQTAENQSTFRKGLNTIIQDTNDKLQRKFTETRSILISGLADSIRSQTGIRGISAPTNVYLGDSLAQFALDQLRSFANLGVSTALGAGAGFLNKGSQGMENSVFDVANKGVNSLKGLENNKFRGSPFSDGSELGERPNVYRRTDR